MEFPFKRIEKTRYSNVSCFYFVIKNFVAEISLITEKKTRTRKKLFCLETKKIYKQTKSKRKPFAKFWVSLREFSLLYGMCVFDWFLFWRCKQQVFSFERSAENWTNEQQ